MANCSRSCSLSHGACLYIEYECCFQDVVTFIFHDQSHSISSSIARDNARIMFPCYVLYIRYFLCVVILIVIFNSSCACVHTWQLTLFQYRYCTCDSSQNGIIHLHRSYYWSYHKCVYRIKCRTNRYCIIPLKFVCNQ